MYVYIYYMGVCICMLCIYTVHIQYIYSPFQRKTTFGFVQKWGIAPCWDTLVSHKPVCVKTLVPFWRFKILELWIITTMYGAVRSTTEIQTWQRRKENIFPPFSASEFFNEPCEAHWPIPRNEAAHRSLQCLPALHDAHNHGLKWPHSVISDFATGKIHHFIRGIVPLNVLRLWTMFHCHAMENHMIVLL